MSISASGLVSGLDTNSIIEQLLTVQQKPIVKLQQKEAAYQVELTAYGNLKGLLGNLRSAMENLKSAGQMTRFSAISSDVALFTAAADRYAAPGDYNVTVQQLAKAHKLTSGAFAEEEPVGEGTLHLQVGTGGITDITVSATATLNDVARAVNAANAGVRAGVIFDGTNYFLSLSARTTGADNAITLTATDTGDADNTDMNGLSRLVYASGGVENLTNTQPAADAIITVDGVAGIHRSTNVIKDAITGVTLTLESAPEAPDNEAKLTVSRDTTAVYANITAFVDAYNALLDFFQDYQRYDPKTGDTGVLLGDATTNSVRTRINSLVTGTIPQTTMFSRLADLGIALNSDGRLAVDPLTLTGALNDNFDDVLQFFTRSTSEAKGFAVRLVDTLKSILDTKNGTLVARTDGIQQTIRDIGKQVETIEVRNSVWETRTRSQFNALELLLAEYQSTGNYLTQQITGLQNLNNYISNR